MGKFGSKEYRDNWYQANKERIAVERRIRRMTMKDELSAYNKAYYEANKAKRAEYTRKRQGNIKYASTINSDTDYAAMNCIYAEARGKTESTGVPHVVDHYWPLNGKYSCGLHVPSNLQVITQADNDAKGNKEPEVWWGE